MARAPAVQDIEPLPEADRLEGLPHPRETSVLYGHSVAERALAEAFAGGRMHHAWLFTGRVGIGKATLAYRLARYLLAGPNERDPGGRSLEVPTRSIAFRQVSALSHPGLLILRRPYDVRSKRLATAIPVDEVRRLKSFLGLTSGGDTWRVVIVDGADELNPNAANALLKSLEEPPRRTLFALLASEPSALLPTLRSRCRRLDLQPLAASELRAAAEEALEAAGIDRPSDADWERLERLAAGSVRRLLQLIVGGGPELQESIARLFSELPRVDWSTAHALAETLAGPAQEQRFEVFFDLLLDTLTRVVRALATGQAGPAELTLAKRLIPETRLREWAELWQALLRDKAVAEELNLDRRALITRAIARLEAISKP
jgi:DNA polymerase-3 subunit delta'